MNQIGLNLGNLLFTKKAFSTLISLPSEKYEHNFMGYLLYLYPHINIGITKEYYECYTDEEDYENNKKIYPSGLRDVVNI